MRADGFKIAEGQRVFHHGQDGMEEHWWVDRNDLDVGRCDCDKPSGGC